MSLLTNMFKLPPPPIGVGLSDRAIEAVAFRRDRSGLELLLHEKKVIPQGIVERGAVVDTKKSLKALREFYETIRDALGTVPSIVAALPEHQTFLQVLSVPAVDEEEKLTEAVRWETAGTIPDSIDDVVLDFSLLPFPAGKKRHRDVLVGTAAKEDIVAMQSVFQEAGFHLAALDLEPLAIIRSLFNEQERMAPTLIVDIGDTRTTFAIVGGGAVLFTSTVDMGVLLMEKALERELSLEPEEAQQFLVDIGTAGKVKKNKKTTKKKSAIKEDDILDVLLPILTDLNQQIREYLSYYRTHAEHAHTKARSIQGVLLSGKGARIQGLPEYLALQLRLPVRQGNPWEGAHARGLQTVPDIPFEESLSYTTTIGLALHSL